MVASLLCTTAFCSQENILPKVTDCNYKVIFVDKQEITDEEVVVIIIYVTTKDQI